MSLRLAIALTPVVVGWLLATFFTIRAYSHLRRARPGQRLFALFFGEFGVALYSPEGHRYRMLALLSFVIGVGITITLAMLLGI